MSFDDIGSYLPFLLMAVIAGIWIRGIAKYGMKGSFFRARIARTIGEARGNQSIGSIVARVHVLEGGSPERSVGLEIVAKTILSYQSLPIPLSREEARSLATMLEQAAKEAPG